jgi:hypothetical protein
MEKVSATHNLLPTGWNADKQKECGDFGMGDMFSSQQSKGEGDQGGNHRSLRDSANADVVEDAGRDNIWTGSSRGG